MTAPCSGITTGIPNDVALAFDKKYALAIDKRRTGWNTNGTNALRAGGAGIALTAREPAMVVSAKDAPERADARTAKEQAANRRSPPVERWIGYPVPDFRLSA
jgi:hypothetical protein